MAVMASGSSAALMQQVHGALLHGLSAGDKYQRGSTWETDFLAGLFSESLVPLRHAFQKALMPLGADCRIHGVYCHQSPKVEIPAGRCELGDLLIAVHYEAPGLVHRHALLLQFKVEGRRDVVGAQQELYEHWPKFNYVSGLTGQRNVSEPRPHRGGQYGYFRVCPHCQQFSCPRNPDPGGFYADMPLGRRRNFADEFMDLVYGRTGRTFTEFSRARTGKDWDRVIWDLLLETAKRVYNNARAGHGQRKRGDLDQLLMERSAVALFLDGPAPALWRSEAVAERYERLRALDGSPEQPIIFSAESVEDDGAIPIIFVDIFRGGGDARLSQD